MAIRGYNHSVDSGHLSSAPRDEPSGYPLT